MSIMTLLVIHYSSRPYNDEVQTINSKGLELSYTKHALGSHHYVDFLGSKLNEIQLMLTITNANEYDDVT